MKIKVVILCGGMGTRLREETEIKPKPMVEIGGMPIIWHIMKNYSKYKFNDFILCLGYKGDIIKEYFYHYEIFSNDFTIDLESKKINIHPKHSRENWKITIVDTGLNSMTGSRIKRIEKYIKEDLFMVTYGDGVTDLDINKLLKYHINHGKTGTVTGVSPPSRFGELTIKKNQVISFQEKPKGMLDSINGGYFVFKKDFFNYLKDEDNCILEREPLEKLAKNNELNVYKHKGFWQCMDTYRDYKYLNELWESGKAPWKIW